jgi:F0F1-type ATP synthase assembly protein I
MDVAGLIGVTLLVSIPIIAIICETKVRLHKKSKDMELRKIIIENKVDSESIKLLISEQVRSSKFVMLRWGGILLGAGLGAIVSAIIGFRPLYFWIPIVIGIGCCMLAAFVAEYKLSGKIKSEKKD